jgi:hypothetical protein
MGTSFIGGIAAVPQHQAALLERHDVCGIEFRAPVLPVKAVKDSSFKCISWTLLPAKYVVPCISSMAFIEPLAPSNLITLPSRS